MKLLLKNILKHKDFIRYYKIYNKNTDYEKYVYNIYNKI